MITFPNAKINLGLNILRKRDDGFHDIETLFYPVAMRDVLEIVPASDGLPAFSSSGLDIPGDPSSNLCVKAWNLLAAEHSLPPVKIHLHKVIPMGAGLGGGSSDGAFTLRMLDEMLSLGLAPEELAGYAATLGSDCPFFLVNKPVFASGRGEIIEPFDISLDGYRVVVRVPDVHVGTVEAYSMIRPGIPSVSLKNILSADISSWKMTLHNDFEAPVISKYPMIGELKAQFYREGAVYASMTGSGSAVFGIFRKE
jgi:4-diphosphocytidyl-2-C-methyl-D-erythritol kinase